MLHRAAWEQMSEKSESHEAAAWLSVLKDGATKWRQGDCVECTRAH